MKKILFVLALFASGTISAQIHIGSNQIATANRPGKIKSADWEQLKKTTTLFTLPYKEYTHIDDYNKAIQSVWTITPFKIIRPEEMEDYMGKGDYSFFSFGGYVTSSRSGAASDPSSMHISYDLWQPVKGSKSKQDYFARIIIYPDNQTFFTAMRNINRRKSDYSAKMLSFIYNDAVLYNWGAGLLKGYLKKVNDHLSAKDERGPFSEETDKQSLSNLGSDTLYVPDYVFIKFNMFSGGEKKDEDVEEEDLKKAYPHPVRIVSGAELHDLILNSPRKINYLVYIKSSTDKYINVYSSDGRMLYANYTPLSYNFKNKDLAKIAKFAR